MRQIKIWIIIAVSCIASPYLAHKMHAICNTQNDKGYKSVNNCAYSQKELKRILGTNKDRYAAHCKDKTCFYCGCSVEDHSE